MESSFSDTLPAPARWLLAGIKALGFYKALLVGVLWFSLGVVRADVRHTNQMLEQHMQDFSRGVAIAWANCRNEAKGDVEIARCGPEPR